jgi:tetratricopeptide (TPR) repeat protein
MEAVSDAPASPGLALLLHEAARAYFFNGLPEPVRPLCQRALEMAGHFDMVDVQADALATLGLLEDQPPEEALDLLTEAVELAEAAGLLYQATRAHTNLAHVLYNSMVDLQAARDHDRRAAELSRQRGSITSQLLGLGNVTHLSLLLGDFEEVEATLHKSRQLLTEIADPGTAAIHIRINEAMLLRCRGELTAAARLLRASQAEARQRGDLQDLFSANTDLADILLETCDPTTSEAEMAEAEVALLEAIETAERAGWSSVQPICQLSRVRTHQGQLKAAHRLLAQANEGSHSQPSAFDETHLMWAQMSLAAAERRWSEALAAMESAASFYARADMHWWRARALQESAELHASWDDPGQARDLERAVETLRQARAVFEAIGASGYVTFIEKRLSALQAG